MGSGGRLGLLAAAAQVSAPCTCITPQSSRAESRVLAVVMSCEGEARPRRRLGRTRRMGCFLQPPWWEGTLPRACQRPVGSRDQPDCQFAWALGTWGVPGVGCGRS